MALVSYVRDGAVGMLEMEKPPANAYDIDFMRALDAAIDQAEADDDCRAVIVRSRIKGFFCGGADIKRFLANTAAQNMEMIALAHQTLSRPSASAKLYIAEIGGHALGGGLEIALACDFRIGAKGTYRMGLPEVTLGILPGNQGTQRLPALIGPNKALELMVTGSTLTPEEAHRLGILNQLVDVDALANAARDFAARIAQSATLAVGQIKRAVYDGYSGLMEVGFAIERRGIAALFASADATEGFAAFQERRKPKFSGR